MFCWIIADSPCWRKIKKMTLDVNVQVQKLLSRFKVVPPTAKIMKSDETTFKSRHRFKAPLTVGLIGLILLAVATSIMFVHPYDIMFKWKIIFTEGGEIFETWRLPPVDLYLRVHLFNITNAEEFLRGEDEKLKVKEVGPYVYREVMTHENVTFNENGTVSAIPKHPLEWVPELSNGDHEKDQLTLINIALLSIADVISKKSVWQRWGLNVLIKQTKTQPIVKMSPKEFMFGYQSTLMTLGYQFLPTWINFDKLGLIDRMYHFDGDYETVYTGKNDVTKAGLIDTYCGSTHIPQWEGYCGDIQYSSDGTKFESHLDSNRTLKFFRKSLCRAKPIEKVNETVSSGLRGFVYKFPKNANDNGFYDEKNKCFCREEPCLPRGLLDVRECYYGFPIALSYPHFLDGDESLFKDVEGMVPDRTKHESYFVINPESGLPLDLAVRYQINMAIGDTSGVSNSDKFANKIIPMLWTENRLYKLPESLATRFKMYLTILPWGETAAIGAFFVLGVTFILLSLHRYRTSKKLDLNWLGENENRIERKLSVYLPDNKSNMSNKELEVYYNSLVAPLNQKIDIEHETDEDIE
ncbi:scavenger receptor class B member 1-like isoform X1 [Onthophagus taurus]|uniref:scavenger receptor class B member 1-like isoform X1 n=1 Tax=Onthophagus taurus TaxID=166361 RepID=UPI0039BEB092